MAYETGTVVSPTALKTVIETFATTNGWALSGSDYLYKGQSFVKLIVPAGPSTTTLQLQAANSSDGVTAPYEYVPFSYIDAASWPITYYLFVQANPDILVCVLQYDTNKIQPIIFGDIQKVHTSAYVGGNFVFAPKYNVAYQTAVSIATLSDTTLIGAGHTDIYRSGVGVPFASGEAFNTTVIRSCAVYAEIDTNTWKVATTNSAVYQTGTVILTDYTLQEYFRSPNTWNNQAQLVPIHLNYSADANLVMYLGYIEHLRFIRVDNYEIGDIVTLGSDKWKVFPWSVKDTTNRNGLYNVSSTGTLGFAVRYDGP